jgi:hypothetical protein
VIDDATRGLPDADRKKVEKACRKWVEYEEYLHVRIDTEAGTCTPIPVRK